MSPTMTKPAAAGAERKRRPRRKLPNPAEQMREHLARLSGEGWPFDLAWDRAWRKVRWPDKREPREEWKLAISSGRPHWERSYNKEGEAIDIRHLVDALSRGTDLCEAEPD